MAFTSGTATNYHDLLDIMKNYLVSQGWTVLAYTLGATLNDDSELHIQFPGVNSYSGVLNIRTRHNVGAGYYGYQSTVSKTYNPSVAWGSQVSESPAVFTNMWDQSLGYWMYVNDRRIILSVKVSSVYASAFWGMFLPFATPDEYPYPYYIGSNFSALSDFTPAIGSVYNPINVFIASPGVLSAYYYSRNESWKLVQNNSITDEETGRIWPHGNMGIRDTGLYSYDTWLANSRPNAANETLVIPCHIVSHNEKTMIGVLDGVHAIPGFGKGTEQQAVLGSRTFRIFQDMSKTLDSSYMAIEEQ
jgi:hypothetical protein